MQYIPFENVMREIQPFIERAPVICTVCPSLVPLSRKDSGKIVIHFGAIKEMESQAIRTYYPRVGEGKNASYVLLRYREIGQTDRGRDLRILRVIIIVPKKHCPEFGALFSPKVQIWQTESKEIPCTRACLHDEFRI